MHPPFVAELRLFSFGFAPAGWADCDGRLLDIDAHQPLFSLLGWRHGGDHSTTFGLPMVRFVPPSMTLCIATSGAYVPRSGEPPLHEPYVGEICMFAGPFAPAGWIECDGRRLPMTPENEPLYRVIGKTYGGDDDAFQVPDLRAQSPDSVKFIIAARGLLPVP